MSKSLGKKNWLIPDCELPPAGEGILKGHESVIVVNDSEKTAEIKVTLYFADKNCNTDIVWTVLPKRVRCFRMNVLSDMANVEIPLETQYAMKLESSENIAVQYGRLDNRQTNLAYYTEIPYNE